MVVTHNVPFVTVVGASERRFNHWKENGYEGGKHGNKKSLEILWYQAQKNVGRFSGETG